MEQSLEYHVLSKLPKDFILASDESFQEKEFVFELIHFGFFGIIKQIIKIHLRHKT